MILVVNVFPPLRVLLFVFNDVSEGQRVSGLYFKCRARIMGCPKLVRIWVSCMQALSRISLTRGFIIRIRYQHDSTKLPLNLKIFPASREQSVPEKLGKKAETLLDHQRSMSSSFRSSRDM